MIRFILGSWCELAGMAHPCVRKFHVQIHRGIASCMYIPKNVICKNSKYLCICIHIYIYCFIDAFFIDGTCFKT